MLEHSGKEIGLGLDVGFAIKKEQQKLSLNSQIEIVLHIDFDLF